MLGFRHSLLTQTNTTNPVRPLRLCRRGSCCCSSSLPHADVAPPDSVPLLPALGQCEGGAVEGGGVWLYPGKPETVDVGKVVAGSSRPLTLNKGLSPEVCQTAARWRQRLATPLITCACMLQSQEMTSFSSDMLHQQKQYTTLRGDKYSDGGTEAVVLSQWYCGCGTWEVLLWQPGFMYSLLGVLGIEMCLWTVGYELFVDVLWECGDNAPPSPSSSSTVVIVLLGLQYPPWGRSIRSTGSSSLGGSLAGGRSGCAVRWVRRGLHTPHSGWCDLRWRLHPLEYWGQLPSLTANRICHYD